MHNIKEIRNDIEAFKKALNKRFLEIDVDKILSLDESNREHIQQRELLEKRKKIFQNLKISHFLKNLKKLLLK
jgi:seryl-tRNA synthetase